MGFPTASTTSEKTGSVRQIALYRATHSTILVYTLPPEMLDAYKAGRTPEYIRVSEQIADHYGIPSLNLAKYAADRILAGAISFEAFSSDGINPTDAGAKIYAEAVAAFVRDLMTAHPVPEKPQRVELPAPLFPETNDNGQIVVYEDPQVVRSGHWKPGQASPIGPFRHILVSEEPGAALTLQFKGSEIDTTSDNFRYAMQKVAAEEECAFFDMTGPWWAYIERSGKTGGWFMGDAVHANQRGCQILGRLLERWFTE